MGDAENPNNENIPIRYQEGGTEHFKGIIEKARQDIEGVTGDADSIPRDMITVETRSRIGDLLEVNGLEADFRNDEVIVKVSTEPDPGDKTWTTGDEWTSPRRRRRGGRRRR